MHCHTYCLTQPEHAVYWAWHIYAHTAFRNAPFALHCLPCAILDLIHILQVPQALLYARARTHSFTHRKHMIINDYDHYVRSLNERQLHEEQLHMQEKRHFQGVSTNFWIRPATWLHVHVIAVPIFLSPQHSWWGLVLAKMHPAQRVTLHNIQACLIREMWFIDCS